VGLGQWRQGAAWPRHHVSSGHFSPQQNAAALIFFRFRHKGDSFPSRPIFCDIWSLFREQVLCGAAHTVILTSFGKVLVCGAANAGQLGLGSLQSDIPSLSLVSLPAFACDIGVGWECTIVVTHAREKAEDIGTFSTSSSSRLRSASDCSDNDLGGLDAPSPSVSELSGSIVTEGPSAGIFAVELFSECWNQSLFCHRRSFTCGRRMPHGCLYHGLQDGW
jgi:hypothetical protein